MLLRQYSHLLLKWRRTLLLMSCIGLILLSTNFLLLNNSLIRTYLQDDSRANRPSRRPYQPDHAHPISALIADANAQWHQYERDRSSTFRDAVEKYRQTYGRHPPPGFKEWYIFARKAGVHNVDDFKQIHDDLRPFWGVPPADIRKMAAKLQVSGDISGIQVRDHKVAGVTNPGWRVDTLAAAVSRLAVYLPDMDIAMNRLDQPRLTVPYEDMEKLLEVEQKTRKVLPNASDHFTAGMDFFLDLKNKSRVDEKADPAWFHPPIEEFRDLIRGACSPESPARNKSMSVEDADKLYKTALGGFSTNFTLSTDLCTVGPAIWDKHGFLFAPSSLSVSKKLLPVFGECKVSVNNEILFPANMYMMKDERYIYNAKSDLDWQRKNDSLLWRGATSGGVAAPENWRRMHRQRLVLLTNGTEMNKETVPILSQTGPGKYEEFPHFQPSEFAKEHFDVGFTEKWACVPNCDFYKDVMNKPNIPLTEQFRAKYLIDVDGHSFSGRWRAFHFSKSLGLKATIFREWHDSRLFAWRHFVPLDNRYDDLYPAMTYLIGTGQPPPPATPNGGENATGHVYVREHDAEAEMIAMQSREWAQKVLRDEDIDIYLLRLLLEYGRVIDDNRDEIGYTGDGWELDELDSKFPIPVSDIPEGNPKPS